MARLPKGILGPFIGKVGPVVGSTWNGIAYIRSKPKKKRKKKTTRSAGQIANQAKFKFTNHWMVPFHSYIIVGFGNFPADKPPVSMAFAVNFREAVIGSFPEFDIDYAKVVLSIGSLPGLTDPVMSIIAPDTIALTWDQTMEQVVSYNDQLVLVLFSRKLELTDGFVGGVKRASGKLSFQFDSRMIGEALDVYIFVTSLDRSRISNSVYLGRTAL
jgi:hypothetical protein